MIATQVQIALRVRGGLAPALGASAAETGPQPRNEQAYDLFLKSAALPLDAGRNPKAVEMLEKAVKLDPTYPPAWLALARRYYLEARMVSGRSTMERALRQR